MLLLIVKVLVVMYVTSRDYGSRVFAWGYGT